MKNKVFILTCIAVLIAAVTAFASVQLVTENNNIQATDKVQIIGNDTVALKSKFDEMASVMNKKIEDDVQYNLALLNYKYLQQGYKISEENLEYIADLIIAGYDAADVIDCAFFWLDTSEEVSLVKNMCDWKIKNPKYDGSFWTDHAFNAVTNNKCGVLDEEDFEAYAAKGIMTDEILTANRLCRKGVYTIQEILKKYEDGASMAEIALEIENKSPQTKHMDATFVKNTATKASSHPKADDRLLFQSRDLAVLTDSPNQAYYDPTDSSTDIETELALVTERYAEDIKSELRQGGYLRTKEKGAE